MAPYGGGAAVLGDEAPIKFKLNTYKYSRLYKRLYFNLNESEYKTQYSERSKVQRVSMGLDNQL